MIAIDIVVEGGGWPPLDEVEPLARQAVDAALSASPLAPPPPLSLSLLLDDDAGVRTLNSNWRGFDKPTNVLSFPAPPQRDPDGVRHLGDIALAYETLAREAAEEGKSLADHLTHLVVHGVLHLIGHDHETEAEAEAMEALEIAALAQLGVANPYRDVAA